MKTKCDNDCGTCPMSNQMFCILSFTKANNMSIKSIMERLDIIEKSCGMLNGGENIINPMSEVQNDPAQTENQ